MTDYIDFPQSGTWRFTAQMRRAIARIEGAGDGRLATEAECASWLETEVNELCDELIATHGTQEERIRCRQLRRRGEWRQHRSFVRACRGEHKKMGLVWACLDEAGNKVPPPDNWPGEVAAAGSGLSLCTEDE